MLGNPSCRCGVEQERAWKGQARVSRRVVSCLEERRELKSSANNLSSYSRCIAIKLSVEAG